MIVDFSGVQLTLTMSANERELGVQEHDITNLDIHSWKDHMVWVATCIDLDICIASLMKT